MLTQVKKERSGKSVLSLMHENVSLSSRLMAVGFAVALTQAKHIIIDLPRTPTLMPRSHFHVTMSRKSHARRFSRKGAGHRPRNTEPRRPRNRHVEPIITATRYSNV